MRLALDDRLFHAGRRRAERLRNRKLLQQLAEALAVFRQIDALGRGADDGHARGFQRQRQIQRRLPAELHDHADLGAARSLVLVDRHHVFVGQRLEVEAVAGVVVGRDGLRIAVDHDGLVAVIAQREGRVAAAVIELDSLPDAIGPAAQDDDLLAVSRRRLVLFFVGRVQIRRVALELGGAGVDALEYRPNVVLLAKLMDLLAGRAAVLHLERFAQARVGEAHALDLAQPLGVDRLRAQLRLHIGDLLQLVQEPGIDVGHLRQSRARSCPALSA